MTIDDIAQFDQAAGSHMHEFGRELFPICRSLTGAGTRQTLEALRTHIPEMTIHHVPSGTQVFDWVIPDEWNIVGARLIGPEGQTVADFAWNNLHVVGYSEPIDETLTFEDLQPHLHSLPDQPDAIPYVTSYYSRYWGFCLTQKQRDAMKPGQYRAVIESSLKPGQLSYGEVILAGETDEELFISTYVCHPSMANNELSGPLVTTWLVKWLRTAPRRYTYRIAFVPETIGSIAYLSRNFDRMKTAIIAGFNLTCIGDERAYSYLPSRAGDTLADRVAIHVLKHTDPNFARYTFLDRGSDERQYCAPGIDLPVASVMRTKYGMYPEYHTSLDNFDLVTPAGLAGGLEAVRRCIEIIEANHYWKVTVLCEPQLGKRGLYPTISKVGTADAVATMMNLICFADGTRDLVAIAETIGVPVWDLIPICEKLSVHGLIAKVDEAC